MIVAFGCILYANTASAEEVVSPDSGITDEDRTSMAFKKKDPYSPYAGVNFQTRPFFGDTHLYTSLSFGAGMVGQRFVLKTPIALPSEKR